MAAAAGGSLDDIVKLTVYLTDLNHFARVNEIMATYFPQPYPARAAVGVAALPRGARVYAGQKATLAEILTGPAHENDGTLNLFGALRTSMATTGYETVKEFQKAEVMVAPSLQTEGKSLQRAQGIGMGR